MAAGNVEGGAGAVPMAPPTGEYTSIHREPVVAVSHPGPSGLGLDRSPRAASFAEPQYDGVEDIPELVWPAEELVVQPRRSLSYSHAIDRVGLDSDADSETDGYGNRPPTLHADRPPALHADRPDTLPELPAFKKTVYISDSGKETLRTQSVTRINPLLALLPDDTARAVAPDSLPVAKNLVSTTTSRT